MKILHTSDWHLGQTFYDYDRTAEQQDMLDQIAKIISEEQPDALLICGDIFHTSNPTTKAVEMYNRALLKMRDACQSMHIIVTAGNHDSAARLIVNNSLWQYFNVDIVGNVARDSTDISKPDFDKHIIEIKSSDGHVVGYVAAVPHCYESNFPSANPDLVRQQRVEAYFKGLSDRISEINTGRLPVVLMAHLAVKKSDYSGHDNIGGMEEVDADIFGDGYDYVALGHIHKRQDIIENRIRYCGTPIPVNFGERSEHSVSIVDLQKGCTPVITNRKINNLIPLKDFPTVLPANDLKEEDIDEANRPKPFAEVLKLVSQFPAEELCYLRLVVKLDETMTPLADIFVDEAVREKKCRICRIQTYRYKTAETQSFSKAARLTGEDVKTMSPIDAAEMLFQMRGLPFTDRHREMIREAIKLSEKED